MMTCWIPNNMLRCGPSRNTAKSVAMTLAEANDSQAWANRLSVSISGAMTNILLGLWGGGVFENGRVEVEVGGNAFGF